MAESGVSPGPDLLRAPVLGRFLRWRHARSVLQGLCLALAVLILLDGFFGPQLAPANLAGTIPWVHWRGFVVLALLVVGNLFCMACPFMLPRRVAKRFGPARLPWPGIFRGKWLALGLLLLFFWAYEAFALWSSPWLTAWVGASYFALAFVIDGFFKGAAFCKHVCPIGQFHFVNGMVSPTEVTVRDPAVCERCTTLDCIRGRYDPTVAVAASPGGRPLELDPDTGTVHLRSEAATPSAGRPTPRPPDAAAGRALGGRGLIQGGCELALFQPKKEGNGDCTFCMECIHACPHDNVGILLRSPLKELNRDPVRSGIGRLSRKPDWAALALLLTFGAFLNAFGMTAPVFRLQQGLSDALGLESRIGMLAIFFLGGLVVLPSLAVGATAWWSRAWSGGSESLVRRVCTYAWALVPVGMGMWTAHYLFHFLTGGLTIVPLAQEYLSELGLPSGGAPRWGAGAMVPESWLLPLEVLLLQGGLILSLVAGYCIARREEGSRRSAGRAFLPWAVLATVLALVGIWLMTQPMEMRGTFDVV
jgi:ferredoxin